MKAASTLIALAMLAAPVPMLAQDRTFNDRQLELYSEMWAMAGICSQYNQFRVSNENLAERLNSDLEGISPAQRNTITQRKDAKLAEIATRVDQLRAMPRGAGRVDAVQNNTEALLTRCQRLANHSVARTYFARRY